MLVDDPTNTLLAMCYFKDDIVDLNKYKKKYEEKIGREYNPIHIKTAHTHFYTLTSFGFLLKTDIKGTYILSNESKQLCNYMLESNIEAYKDALRYILINNPKTSELFKDFIEFVKIKSYRLRNEVYNRYKTLTSKTLIAWSIEAGLIDEHDKKMWYIPPKNKIEFSDDEFWEDVKTKYSELRKSEIFGIDKVYVDIRDLSFQFCIQYRWTQEEFDEKLRANLDTKFGLDIMLYGAPTSYFENKKNFFYNDRVYAFIRIMVN